MDFVSENGENLFAALFQAFPNGALLIYDQNLRYVHCGGEALDNAGVGGQSMMGKFVDNISVDGTMRSNIVKNSRRALKGQISETLLSFKTQHFRLTSVPLVALESPVAECPDFSYRYGLNVITDVSQFYKRYKELMSDNEKLISVNEAILQDSQTDSLTGLWNRRYLDQSLVIKWRTALRNDTHIAILMIDVDHFKLVNDNEGHIYGDECLQKIADILKESVKRPEDIIARYGGEEFAILLASADLAGAIVVAEKIQAALERENIKNLASPVSDRLTVSIGCAAIKAQRHCSISQLMDLADKGLYTAKRKRNTISCKEWSIDD